MNHLNGHARSHATFQLNTRESDKGVGALGEQTV